MYQNAVDVMLEINRNTKQNGLWPSPELTSVSMKVSPKFALMYLLNLSCLSHLTLLA